ncbi:MAG: malto-oligosyltrehalose synthase [Gemmataceae bacterium]
MTVTPLAFGRVPRATYRLQLTRAFTFRDAATIADYLAELGISDAYASPVLQARPGSTHGYDVTDHGQLSADLGGEEAFEVFSAALQKAGLGLILDTVPNHMGIGDPTNGWWADVLENGPSSAFASHFDIDWHPVKPEMADKVLLPILEDQYGTVLEKGKFHLTFDDGRFLLHVGSVQLPVGPRSYATILGRRRDALLESLDAQDPCALEYLSILTAIGHLPPRGTREPEKIAERQRESSVVRRRLAALYRDSAAFRAFVDGTLADFNGNPADPNSFEAMHELIDAQAYRPAFWRVAGEEINYRRFFDINDLAAIRVELPEVFEATHAIAFKLLAEGKATGLRIDHPDGLRDPVGYFRQLQERFVAGVPDAPPLDDWFTQASGGDGRPAWPLYVVAEKILAEGEPLPADWAVAGTVGYDFLTAVNGLFVDRRYRRTFDRLYGQFCGHEYDFGPLVAASKRVVMMSSMAGELNSLAYQLDRLANRNRRYRDFTLNLLTRALREVIAFLPVYRTYITAPGTVLPRDAAYIEQAVAEAKRRNARVAASIFDFLRDTLLLENVVTFRAEDQPGVVNFVRRFQQVTGPVMAKGVEDTAFYVFNRLVSLNEVGGSPEEFGVIPAAFHRRSLARLQSWPHTMLGTATHDTKRGEDTRARINVLSEVPEEWRQAILRWTRMNTSRKSIVKGEFAPDRNDEYLFYQVMLGAWPNDPTPEEFTTFRGRLANYMLKAIKEAEVHTSWVNPNADYEEATKTFVEQVLSDDPSDPFRRDLDALQKRVAFFGQVNSLSQTLLKLTSPGVPDFYQGSELWDLTLVDPDNRRPVDYVRRRELLAGLKSREPSPELAAELLAASNDGRVKMYLTQRALQFRAAHEDLFCRGEYRPLRTVGRRRKHTVAFARLLGEALVTVVVPRLAVGLTGGAAVWPLGRHTWRDTWLVLPREAMGRTYRDVFTGIEVAVREADGIAGLPLSEVLRAFPVALLERV